MHGNDDIASERPKFPYSRIPRFSNSWAEPLIEKAREGSLTSDDMFQTPQNDNIWSLYQKYKQNWPRFEGRQFAEFKCLLSIFVRDVASNILLVNVTFSMEIVRAIGFRELLLSRSDGFSAQLLLGIFFVAFASYIKTPLVYQLDNNVEILVRRMKAVIQLVIYEKATKISTVLNHKYNESDIAILLHNDVDRLFAPLHYGTIAFGIGCTMYASLSTLYDSAGATVIVLWVVLVIVLLLSVVAALIGFRERTAFKVGDFRFGLLRELLKNIHIVKFYGWEVPLADVVESYRSLELRIWRIMRRIQYLISGVLTSLDDVASAVAFIVILKLGKRLTADVAFPTVCLLYITTAPLILAPGIVSRYGRMVSSFDRLNAFFGTIEPHPAINTMESGDQVVLKMDHGDIGWHHGETQYTDETNTCIIRDLNLKIERGTFVAVTGSVGCGKTTLLMALQGLANLSDSPSLSISRDIKISSVLHTWSYRGSVRDNIVFGTEWNSIKYDRIIDQCQLKPDFEQFPDGDLSEIGDGAFTLSGGQRARISLARCLYADPDVFLLDDVFSSVDGLTASQILYELKKLISESSPPKTVVLTTNNLKILQHADSIVYLKGNGDYLSGSLEEMMQDDDFLNKYNTVMGAPDLESDSDLDSLEACNMDAASLLSVSNSELEWELPMATNEVPEGTFFDRNARQVSLFGTSTFHSVSGVNIAPEGNGDNHIFTLIDDDNDANEISLWTMVKFLVSFFTADTIRPNFITSMIVTLVQCTLVVASPLIILEMVKKKTVKEQIRLGWFFLFAAFAQILIRTINRSTWDFVCDAVLGSIHRKSVLSLFRAPISYHESVPLGRIMHRLNQDMSSIDSGLRFQLFFFMNISLYLAGCAVLVVYLDSRAGVIMTLFSGLIVIWSMHRKSAISGVYGVHAAYKVKAVSVITEKLNGLHLLVDYNQQFTALKQISSALDDDLMSGAAVRAVTTLYYDTLSLILFFLLALLQLEVVFNHKLSDAEVGTIIEILRLAWLWFENIIVMWNGVGELLTSVEKLENVISRIPQEPYGDSDDVKWAATAGSVEFRDVSFRYRPELPLVLQHFNLSIQGGQSLGICGRTGVGKTTLINSIFRFANLSGGQILIDGCDITAIPLKYLRGSLSIIPQQNVLFRGTVRSNLDPLSEKPDEELWDALRRSGFLEATGGSMHLDSPVEAEGENFSRGESQMIALARALVRKSKILLLDEATSAVDFETDKHIQRTIKEEFAGCTIISIAHRIQTIVKYDRVLAIGTHNKSECGNPLDLYERRGLFWEICEDAGIEYSDFQ